MAKSRWFCGAAIGVLLLVCCSAQGFGGGKSENKIPAVKSDIKYIKCQVCETYVKHAVRSVKKMRDEATPSHKVREVDILESLEHMCDPDVDDGDWISTYDIVEEGTQLKLVETGAPSSCNSECRTIARACENLIEEVDLTELSGKLYSGTLQRAALTNWMCREESDYCSSKVPPVPKDRARGPKHVPLTSDEIERRDMMRKMKKAGLKGTMYNRDNLQAEMEEMREMGYDMGDLDDMDEIDEAAEHKSRPGHKPVEPGNEDLVTDILSNVKDAANVVREGVGQAVESTKNIISSGVKSISSMFKKKSEDKDL